MASLHSRDDIEEADASYVQAQSDADNDGIIENLERLSNVNTARPDREPDTEIPPKKIAPEKRDIQIRRQFSSLFSDWWMGELLAISISSVSLIAIVLILLHYNDQALTELPHDVSLNFIVSILATLSKSSLLFAVASAITQCKWLWISAKYRSIRDLQIFDESNRGPWGASRLLLSGNGQSWGSIGAVVTLLCLVYDPFVQGLISTPERIVYRNDSNSLVNRILDFPVDQYEIMDRPNVTNSVNSLIEDDQLMRAINHAISTPIVVPETQPRCPKGNCTWQPFKSLGFCYDCQDVTPRVQLTSNYTNYGNTTKDDSSVSNRYSNWTYTLPEMDGQYLGLESGEPFFTTLTKFSERPDDFNGARTAFVVIPLTWNGTTINNFTDSTSIPFSTVVAFVRLSTMTRNRGAVSSANICKLRFCAQKRNVSVTLNHLSSTILGTAYGSQKPVNDNSYLEFFGSDIDMTYPSNLTWLDLGNSTWPDWYVGLEGLNAFLKGNLTVIEDRVSGEDRFIDSSPGFVTAFERSTNLSMTMNNFATALTNYFRDSSNATVAGQSGQSEAYIRVIWPWLTLPAFLVALGSAFLLLVIHETHRTGMQVWKTSELVLFFHGAAGGGSSEQIVAAANDRQSEMNRLASHVKVQMVREGYHRWRLLRQEDSDV